MMKLAYHTFAFGGRSWLPSWTLEEAMRIIAELGFDGLELGAVRPHGFPADLDKTQRGKILDFARQKKLEYAAICPTSVNYNIASPVVGERKGTVKYIVDCMDLALDLECKIIRVDGGWSVKPFERMDAWKWAAEGLAAVAKEAEKRGVILALEPVNGQRADVVVSSRDMESMIGKIGSPALRPMIDLYHLHVDNEDAVEVVNRLGSQLAYVHFLDARRANHARIAPGNGEMNLVDILNALRKVGYDGWLTFEIWGDDPIAPGKQAVEFFQAYKQSLH